MTCSCLATINMYALNHPTCIVAGSHTGPTVAICIQRQSATSTGENPLDQQPIGVERKKRGLSQLSEVLQLTLFVVLFPTTIHPMARASYRRASGNRILDVTGQPVRIAGINWYASRLVTWSPAVCGRATIRASSTQE